MHNETMKPEEMLISMTTRLKESGKKRSRLKYAPCRSYNLTQKIIATKEKSPAFVPGSPGSPGSPWGPRNPGSPWEKKEAVVTYFPAVRSALPVTVV